MNPQQPIDPNTNSNPVPDSNPVPIDEIPFLPSGDMPPVGPSSLSFPETTPSSNFSSEEQVEGRTPVFQSEQNPVPSGPLSGLKKILPIFLVLLFVVIGIFIVLKFVGGNKSKDVTLTYWGLWENEEILKEIINDFEKENPKIKISYIRSSSTEYRERLTSAFTRNEGPDIFRFHNTWVPMFKNDLAPLPTQIMDLATFESLYYPVVRTDLKLGNSYVGIPLEFDGLGLFINEDIFKTAGKVPPTTWDELRKTALELTVPAQRSKGGIQISGVALGRTENIDHWSDILGVMMLQNGADLARLNSKFAEDSLTYFTLFSRVDQVWDETLPPSTKMFASGRLAMYFGPSWEVFNIKQINPNLNFRIVPIPQLEGANINWASYWVEGVSKKSPNQEAAWKFVKFLSSKENMQKFYQAASVTRLFGEPYSRTDMADLVKDNDFVGAFIKQAPVARSWYLSSRTFDNGINDKMIKYFENAVNAVNAGSSPNSAIQTASAGISQVLSQYGLAASVVR